jgi:uncharacterized protein GlcG (DUF336 family)
MTRSGCCKRAKPWPRALDLPITSLSYAGGSLVAFVRQDGALIGSIDLAIGKATTARIFDKPTSLLAELAQPGAQLFGVQETNSGRVVIFGGGIPVMSDGAIVGAVGASAGTVEQDIAVAQAAVAAFGRPIARSTPSRWKVAQRKV